MIFPDQWTKTQAVLQFLFSISSLNLLGKDALQTQLIHLARSSEILVAKKRLLNNAIHRQIKRKPASKTSVTTVMAASYIGGDFNNSVNNRKTTWRGLHTKGRKARWITLSLRHRKYISSQPLTQTHSKRRCLRRNLLSIHLTLNEVPQWLYTNPLV